MPEPSSGDPVARLTRYSSFSPEVVHRSELKNAPYNPRRITDSARRRLKKNLETVGLVQPIVWNRRTGHIVGGHQKVKCLDALEGTHDYLVPVAVVDMDEVTERAQNIFLNNAEAQGDWDAVLLADALKGIPDVDMTGFDMGDLYSLFGCDPTKVDAVSEGVREAIEPIPEPIPEPVARPDKTDQEWDRRDEQGKDRESGNFYRVVPFATDAGARELNTLLGLDPDARYIDGRRLLEVLRGTDHEVDA
jgi:hypothetical protein